MKEYCRSLCGSNPRPPDTQSNEHPTESPRPAILPICLKKTEMQMAGSNGYFGRDFVNLALKLKLRGWVRGWGTVEYSVKLWTDTSDKKGFTH